MPFIWIDHGMRRNIPVEEPKLNSPNVIAMENQKIHTPPESGHKSFAARLAQRSYDKGQHHLPERQKFIQAHEIMSSPVITALPSTTLPEAWHLIDNHRFRHIPIVDPVGSLLGMLSDRNILRSAATFGWDILKDDESENPEQTIGKLFSAPVLTALPHAEIHQIAQTLLDKHIGAMPIINVNNQVIGIITRSDILRALVHLAPLEWWG